MNAIHKSAPTVRYLIREVREARPELDAVLAELSSLEGVLDLLHEDGRAFPPHLAWRTPPLLEHCASIIDQIDGYMFVCNGLGLTRRDKKFRWLSIRLDMANLRSTLEGYKSVLAVMTDLVGLTRLCDKNDTISVASESSRHQETDDMLSRTNEDLRHDLTRVLADMDSLRTRLQGEFRSHPAGTDLENYLDAMQLHATNLGFRLDAARCETDSTREGVQTPEIPRKSANRNTPSSNCIKQLARPNSSSVENEFVSAFDIKAGPPSPVMGSFDHIFATEPTHAHMITPQVTALPQRPLAEPLPSNLPLTVEIDDFSDDLREPSTRTPTPSPPARATGFSSSSNSLRTEIFLNHHLGATLTPFSAEHLPGLCRPPSTRSLREHSAMHHDSKGNPIVPRRVSSLCNLPGPACGSDAHTRTTIGSLRASRSPDAVESEDVNDAYGCSLYNRSGISMTIVGGTAAHKTSDEFDRRPDSTLASSSSLRRRTSRFLGQNKSSRLNTPTLPARPPRPDSQTPFNNHQRHSSASSSGDDCLASLQGSGLVYNPVEAARNASLRTKSFNIAPTQAVHSHSHHPRRALIDTTHIKSTSSISSHSSRLSSVFHRISMWRPQTSAPTSPFSTKALPEDVEPDDVFGVSLKKSMQIASATVRTHHNGSQASSRRDFPRCIILCVSFFKQNDGVHAPHIFDSDGEVALSHDDGHVARVAALKEAFCTAPWYGEGNIVWHEYDVFDAAELMVLFLQQLRTPLVSETVAKRWISMSRQASLPGSMGLRLDSCLDFWEEALLGVRGAARNLLKLLLDLWGDVADAADVNEMTAERLATRLLGPLMHLPRGKFTTEYILGLAFVIRKRSEYSINLRERRKSLAAF